MIKNISTETKYKINFMRLHKAAFFFSMILTAVIFCTLYNKGLNLGIDFAGGMLIEINTDSKLNEIRELMREVGYGNATIQSTSVDTNRYIIRLPIKNQEEASFIKASMQNVLENVLFERTDFVGPKLGAELIRDGSAALFIAIVSMMIYVWIRFDWYYGFGVLLALMHDMIAVIGYYCITAFEFDSTAIAALLTVLGYSINDSVVIYDRIRSKISKTAHSKIKLYDTINSSLNETLSRTIMTVLTTILACLALVLYGGEALLGFSTSVLFGILFGTYSSICISAPALLYIHKNNSIN